MNKKTKLILLIASLLLLLSILLIAIKSFSTLFISQQVQFESVDNYSIPIQGAHKLLPLSEFLSSEQRYESIDPGETPSIQKLKSETDAETEVISDTAEATEAPLEEPVIEEPLKTPEQEPAPAVVPETKRVNNATSLLHFVETIQDENTNVLTWSDSSTIKPVEMAIYIQKDPFIFNTTDPLGAAEEYILQIPQGGDSIQKYSVKLPQLDPETNRSYLIQAIKPDNSTDQNHEFIYTMAEIQEITLDGSFDDWSDIPLLYRDTVENLQGPGPDWKEIKAARDRESLYFCFTVAYPFTFIPTETYSRVMIMLDVDNNSSTGYQVIQPDFTANDPKQFLGSEFLVTNGKLYKQENSIFNAGEIVDIQSGTNLFETAWKFEIGIPLNALESENNDLSNIRILFFSDGNMDYAPENRDSIILSIPTQFSVLTSIEEDLISELTEPFIVKAHGIPLGMPVKTDVTDNPEMEIVSPETTETQLLKVAKAKEQEPPPAPTEAETKPINETISYIQFTNIVNNPEFDTLTWSDSSSEKPAKASLSVQQKPFFFTENDPFASAKSYSLNLAAGTGETQKYSVNFPVSDPYKNQAYLIQALLPDGSKDGNREFVYKMGSVQEINLDGLFEDWKNIPLLYRDTVENLQGPGPDWKEIKAARDAKYLYFYFTAAYPFTFIPIETYSRVMILFDVDLDSNTGYQVIQSDFSVEDPKQLFGSEFLLTNDKLYKQENMVFNAGEIVDIQSGTNLSEKAWKYELGIPLSTFESEDNDLSNIRILFFSDGNMDYAPENRDSIILSLPSLEN
jgi:hypothetical protein